MNADSELPDQKDGFDVNPGQLRAYTEKMKLQRDSLNRTRARLDSVPAMKTGYGRLLGWMPSEAERLRHMIEDTFQAADDTLGTYIVALGEVADEYQVADLDVAISFDAAENAAEAETDAARGRPPEEDF